MLINPRNEREGRQLPTAACYARANRTDHTTTRNLIDRQITEIQAAAVAHGYVPLAVAVDTIDTIGDAAAILPPGLSYLRTLAESGMIDAVFFAEEAALAEHPVVRALLTKGFRSHGVTVRFCKDAKDSEKSRAAR